MTADLTALDAALEAADDAYVAADAAAEAAYAIFEAARKAYVAALDADSINAANAAPTKSSHVTEASVDALREAWLDDSSN